MNKIKLAATFTAVLILTVVSTRFGHVAYAGSQGLLGSTSQSADQCLVQAAKVYLDCAVAKPESGAVKAVDLIAAWVNAGVPEKDEFQYEGEHSDGYRATFETDILPLFTKKNIWYEGARACSSCHFDNSENSYHEMDLSSYAGIMKGGDVLSHPPGVPLFGQDKVGASNYDWSHSKMKERLRNNRMPPGWPEDQTEVNRDGPCMVVKGGVARVVRNGGDDLKYGCDLVALGLLEAWVNARAPKTKTFKFGGDKVNFADSVLPLFTQHGVWFKGSQSCSSCHFNNSENSYHEMDLTSYEGIMRGGDVLSNPPGVPLLGESKIKKTDYDWGHSKMRSRLRNNRMPPGIEFDITEENRDGPLVLKGVRVK